MQKRWETYFEGATVEGLHALTQNSLSKNWHTSLPTEYQFKNDNDTLVVDFTNQMPNGTANYGAFADYFVNIEHFNDAFISSPGDTQDTLRGKTVDMSNYLTVSFTVKANKNLTLRLDLLDKNGKVSNYVSPIKTILAGNGWSTVNYQWTKPSVLDYYSPTWFDATVPDYAVGWPLDVSNIIGVLFTIDDGTVGILGDQKQLKISNLRIGNPCVSDTTITATSCMSYVHN